LAEVLRAQNRFVELVTALDKLDKIGPDGVQRELGAAGFDAQVGEGLLAIVGFAGDTAQTLDFLDQQLTQSETGRAGVAELREVLALHAHFPQFSGRVALDLTLARGLNYYTGTIFEVKAENVQIGSIGGGGRYADLTGLFGLPNLPGVGISFGADRIYDVLDELGLFADLPTTSLRALFVNFGNEAAQHQMLRWVSAVRQAGIPADVYPDTAKLGKQFGYADQRGVPYAVVIGPDDAATDTAQLKDLRSGTQQTVSLDELLKNLG
jgi:histidyl-tRNA synthetase